MWYIYTHGILVRKRNEIGSFVEMWMDVETVILSEVSVSGAEQCDSVVHVHITFEITFHYRLLQGIDYSSCAVQ